MDKQDILAVRDRIATKLDLATREEFLGLFDIVASESMGGMSYEAHKHLLRGNEIKYISWDKYMSLRKEYNNYKYKVVVDEEGAYCVVTEDDGQNLKGVDNYGNMGICSKSNVKLVSGMYHDNFIDAVIEMRNCITRDFNGKSYN